eukprot:SAG11_NODE_14499_length_610_cov_0.710372_2_plen_68_part_01
MEDCIITPAAIAPAASWHPRLPDGGFRYDYVLPALLGGAVSRATITSGLLVSPDTAARVLRWWAAAS